MNSRNILIPIKKDCHSYNKYLEYIRPYLDVFGMPYEEIPTSSLLETLKDDAALILLTQPDLELSPEESTAIFDAIESGCGLFATCSSILDNTEFCEFAEPIELPKQCNSKEITFEKKHYITRYHKSRQSIALYSNLWFYQSSHLKNSITLISSGEAPLLEVSSFGHGKIVLMNTHDWISTDILGPVHGMDDIIREAIVWAAKKPFVMKGMPPFVAMRVDDVWGAWRNITPENPLLWLEIANKYGFKPWLGIFPDNISKKSISIARDYIEKGNATAFPHAFEGCEWTGSAPEDWLWYDHRHQRPWSDHIMKERAEKAKDWFEENRLPISKVALPHYYEMSECALPILLEWGCEFVGLQMPPDAFYLSGEKFKCGPYRKFNSRPAGDNRPVYYADYLSFPNKPVIDKKLFNCVIELHDVSGYELAPTNDVEKTISSGVEQLRRSIISGLPATLFTHESCWIQQVTPENWEAEIKGITEGIADLSPVFDTLDNICKYVRANHNIRITNPTVDESGNLDFTVTGTCDMDTKCYVFSESNSKIIKEERTIARNLL